ncbi:hypothetical protein MtrunA17_Chr8g0342411 [Medicago truncatula]|nr:hypothetical protein MtrunA17_Chr8g0342411 [Medicago truncatula]
MYANHHKTEDVQLFILKLDFAPITAISHDLRNLQRLPNIKPNLRLHVFPPETSFIVRIILKELTNIIEIYGIIEIETVLDMLLSLSHLSLTSKFRTYIFSYYGDELVDRSRTYPPNTIWDHVTIHQPPPQYRN